MTSAAAPRAPPAAAAFGVAVLDTLVELAAAPLLPRGDDSLLLRPLLASGFASGDQDHSFLLFTILLFFCFCRSDRRLHTMYCTVKLTALVLIVKALLSVWGQLFFNACVGNWSK